MPYARGILIGMINRFSHQGIQWIDLESPTPEEVDEIAQELNLAPILVQDLLSPTLKTRVDMYPKVAYAVLHFPSLRHTRGMSAMQEVDFVIGEKFILTSHYDAVPAVYDFARAFEAETLLKHSNNPNFKSGHILLELAERLYQSVENELDSLEDTVGAIEQQIFSGHEREMVVAISAASRELLHMKRTLANHVDVLSALEQMSIVTFGETYGIYLRGVKLFHERVYERALALTDTIHELRSTNTELLSTRQNEIMKNLTMMTFMTAPMAILVGLFGMNTLVPLADNPDGFWFILGGVALLAASFVVYFKAKKWF